MNPACVITDISYIYPGSATPALTKVSLTINQGTSVALLGPNGSGKSTLMDILLRWKHPSEGNIVLFDKPLKSYGKKELGRTIALVPQEEQSRFSFSLFDYVLFGRASYIKELEQPKSQDREIAAQALEQVGLLPLANRTVTELSGGEHQLLLLARALAQKPHILLLDEPTNSLDPANVAKVLTILKSLHEQGITMFFTTHDPMLAAEAATHVALLKEGSLILSGKREVVLQSEILTHVYDTNIATLTYDGQLLVFRKTD